MRKTTLNCVVWTIDLSCALCLSGCFKENLIDEPDAGQDSGGDADTDTDTDVDTDADTDADADTDSDADSDTDSDSDTDTDADTDGDTDTDSDIDTGTDFTCTDDTECPLCQICSAFGECVNADYGDDPKDECPGAHPSTCKMTGDCDGKGACELYGPQTSCDDKDPMTLDDMCDGLGSCIGTHYCENHYCWEVVPTGQDKCYDDDGEIPCPDFPCNPDGSPDFCGQDAQYLPNNREFDVQAVGTENIVIDPFNDLIWQQLNTPNTDWSSAIKLCEELAYANQNDWRLPDYRELFSILDFSMKEPVMDTDVFIASTHQQYWTASLQVGDSSRAWKIVIDNGTALSTSKETTLYVRCVRAGNAVPNDDHSRRYLELGGTGAETVLDRATELEWQKGHVLGLGWRGSLRHCEGLDYSGHDDWRLPNIAELHSLINIEKEGDVVSDFPGLAPIVLNSSTTTTWPYSRDLVVDFASGEVVFGGGSATKCVRGGP